MKRQIVVLHGGTSFNTHEEYLAFLKTRELTLDKLQYCADWRSSLEVELGEEYEVLLPKMPNPTNARYSEWSIWFERCLEFMRDDVILIGHSLGGIFLAKYLSEHSLGKSIKATILVAAPFNDTSTVESLVDFALPDSLAKFEEQSEKIYLFQSKDDPVVPFEEVEEYQQALPKANKVIFEDKQHFNLETFPEMVELIRSL